MTTPAPGRSSLTLASYHTTIMQYEWDEAKRESNLRKHGFDFFAAHRVYESLDKVTLRLKSRSESRLQDIALVEIRGKILTLVYTMRNGKVRCISFRSASRKERRIYAAAKT